MFLEKDYRSIKISVDYKLLTIKKYLTNNTNLIPAGGPLNNSFISKCLCVKVLRVEFFLQVVVFNRPGVSGAVLQTPPSLTY